MSTPAGFVQAFTALLAARQPFAVATVVATHGSSAAKPGAKLLVRADGSGAWGWVGGGCAERHVCEEAQAAMAAAVPRMLAVDLEDEVFGVGMPCGGRMDVFIEPVLPARQLVLPGGNEFTRAQATLAERAGWQVEFGSGPASAARPTDAPFAAGVRWFAALLARERGRSGDSLRRVKAMPNAALPPPPAAPGPPRLLLIGHHRVTEELAWFGARLGWPVCVCAPHAPAEAYPSCTEFHRIAGTLPPLDGRTRAVIATQHRDDHANLRRLLGEPLPYIGLIASAKRAQLVLQLAELPAAPAALHAPAGLDLGAQTPFEMALSIVGEILAGR